MRWEPGDVHGPTQPVSSHARHQGRDCAPGTACPAAGVSQLLGWHLLAAIPRVGLEVSAWGSAAGKAERHPSLSCCDQRQLLIFAPGMPLEPGQTQAMGCPLHTAEAAASLHGFPAWQPSQHPSPTHGPSWHKLRVPVWGRTFPCPPALPSTQHLPATHSQGALEQPCCLQKTVPPRYLWSGLCRSSATCHQAEHHVAAPLRLGHRGTGGTPRAGVPRPPWLRTCSILSPSTCN